MKKIIILVLCSVIATLGVGYFVFNNSEPNPSEQNNDNLLVINDQSLDPEPTPNPNPNPNPEPPLNMLLLDKEQTISFEQCSRRGLDDKVVILVSKYCSACKVVLPILKEIEKELNTKFLYFDLSDKKDLEKFGEYKIQAQWTPTVIIGCEVLIGGYPKEKYKTMIENL